MRLNQKGFTLLEVLISCGLMAGVFAGLFSGFLSIKSMAHTSRHYSQAAHLVRAEIETLKTTAFAALADSNAVVSYDAGADGLYGTADDLTGTMNVTLGDFADMDNDGITTAETFIDVDEDTINDTNARPIRVTFTWNQKLLGEDQNRSVSVDILITN